MYFCSKYAINCSRFYTKWAKSVPKERKAYSNAFLGQVKCYLKTRGWIVFGCTWMSMYSARVWCMHGIMYGGCMVCMCGGYVYSVSGRCDSRRGSARDTFYIRI